MRIGIIGGGITGLTAGYELSRAGHSIIIFEKDNYLGGQAAAPFEVGGERLEKYYHHIFVSDSHIKELIAELGLTEQLIWLKSKVGYYHRGRIYNFVTPIDLLLFKPLSIPDRLRLGIVSLWLQRYSNWHKLENLTVKDWVIKYAGRRNYEVIWEPLLRGKFGDCAEEISMSWFWGKINVRFRSGGRSLKQEVLGYMQGSFGVLIDELRKRIEDRGGTILPSFTVDKVLQESNGGKIVQGAKGEFRVDKIILTVPSGIVTVIVKNLPQDYMEKLQHIRYRSAVCLILICKRSLSPIYWLNISDPGFPFVAVIEHTNFRNGKHYDGKKVIYISNYLSKENRLYSLNSSDLLQEYLPFLKKINPEFDTSWVEQSYIFKEETAQPIVGVDYANYIPEYKMPIKGLYLANTTQIYPEDRGMNYSIKLGREVSQALLKDSQAI